MKIGTKQMTLDLEVGYFIPQPEDFTVLRNLLNTPDKAKTIAHMIRSTTSEDMRDKAIQAFEYARRQDDEELTRLLEYADPCPFCENTEMSILVEAVTDKWYIYCDHCGCCGPIAARQNLAVSLWNERPSNTNQDPTTL
jgi:hypothetical protein